MKKLFLSLFGLLCSTPLVAHPHSFLDMQNKVLINQDKLEGFELTWWLDEITSAELIYEIKSAENQAEAIQKITREMDISAVENHYFSELYNAENQPIKFKAKPQKSSMEIKDNRIVYRFTLALSDPPMVKGQSFRFYTFEPSYYLSMAYESAKDVTASEQHLCKVSMEEPKVNQDLRLYASQLDKEDMPDLPSESLSLGAQFAQKVSIVCK